jgi:hypothetical protein
MHQKMSATIVAYSGIIIYREVSMSSTTEICVMCAWRAICQKKFSVSGRSLHCPDFVRDLSLPKYEEEETKEEVKEKKNKANK